MRILKLSIVFLALLLVVSVLSFFNVDESTDEPEINNQPETDEEGEDIIVDKSAHNYLIECPSCGKTEDYRRLDKFSVAVEDYGSIGFCAYNLDCGYCGVNSSPGFSITHVYSSGACTVYGCTAKCDHTFTADAIEYIIPYRDQFSMYKDSNLSAGASAVYSTGKEMNCTICGKNIE